MTQSPIILALDVPEARQAMDLAARVAPFVGAFKVGKELFVAAGPELVQRMRAQGLTVFLDLKFHDIPQTVARAVASATRLDVQMLTVHASGGSAMLRAAEQAALETAGRLGIVPPLVLAVTVLTSFDHAALAEIGVDSPVEAQVERLAMLAQKAGLRGLVCSPRELSPLRCLLGPEIQLVTPGIRAGTEPPDDQKRTLAPREALAAGANWLVIGRPIHAAPDPRAAAEAMLNSVRLPPIEK